jgi:hypothetical protein
MHDPQPYARNCHIPVKTKIVDVDETDRIFEELG